MTSDSVFKVALPKSHRVVQPFITEGVVPCASLRYAASMGLSLTFLGVVCGTGWCNPDQVAFLTLKFF